MLRVAGSHQTETQVLTISLSTEPFDYNDHIILSCFYNAFMQICKAIIIKKMKNDEYDGDSTFL